MKAAVAQVRIARPSYHLEFTSHVDGSPCPAPSRENLLVLYFRGDAQMYAVVDRLALAGALTFEDPDGWRVVQVATP